MKSKGQPPRQNPTPMLPLPQSGELLENLTSETAPDCSSSMHAKHSTNHTLQKQKKTHNILCTSYIKGNQEVHFFLVFVLSTMIEKNNSS